MRITRVAFGRESRRLGRPLGSAETQCLVPFHHQLLTGQFLSMDEVGWMQLRHLGRVRHIETVFFRAQQIATAGRNRGQDAYDGDVGRRIYKAYSEIDNSEDAQRRGYRVHDWSQQSWAQSFRD